MLYFVGSLIGLTLASLLGAWFSMRARVSGGSVLWLYLVSLLSTSTWIAMMKSGTKMSLATVLFDVVATTVYLVAFVVMGERLTPLQAFGAVLALVGVSLMSL